MHPVIAFITLETTVINSNIICEEYLQNGPYVAEIENA